MKLSEMDIGTKLELQMYNAFGEKIRPSLVSELEWAEGENVAFIAAPFQGGVIYPVHIGTSLNVYFIHNGDLKRFKAKVLERAADENIPLLKIAVESEIERIQRRQFYRFACSLPVKYRVIDLRDQEQSKKVPFKEAVTRDLSGGGLCVIVGEGELKSGELLECELQLSQDSVVRFRGQVVRVSTQELDGKHRFKAGIWFRKIENKDRESIISYIFQEQIRLRKKGLI